MCLKDNRQVASTHQPKALESDALYSPISFFFSVDLKA